jgi:hypothetical protein
VHELLETPLSGQWGKVHLSVLCIVDMFLHGTGVGKGA